MQEAPSSTIGKSAIAQLLYRVEDNAAADFCQQRHHILIGGKWQPAQSGRVLDVIEPSTGQAMGSIAAGDVADVALAVEAAARAFEDGRWSRKSPAEREAILHRLADLMERDAEFLATVETLDNGKPIDASRAVDVPDAIRCLRYMAGWPTKIDGRTLPGSDPAAPLALTVRQPVGVVAAITPWNFPLCMAVQKIAPALAAGCTVVLKPAEQTSLTALHLGALALEAGIPDGVLNIVTGLGAIVGNALVADPRVAKISFTGSTATGIRIGKAAMDNMTRLTMELGGKSPMIVLPDCDLDLAAQGVVDGLFFNSGQVCCAASRLLAHSEIHDALLAKIEARILNLRIGAGIDEGTEIGPLVSELQRDRVRSFIDIGLNQGARVFGGADWEGPGWFVRPTVFADLDHSCTLMRDEIFGPVLVAARFDSTDEVIRLANDSRYGLGASIWSNELAQVRALAMQLRAGTVWVNTHNPVDPALPFGGYGLSGFGREGGPEGIDVFLETKSIWLN